MGRDSGALPGVQAAEGVALDGAPKPAETPADPVLAALTGAPVVPFTPEERALVAEAIADPQGWQTAEEFATKLAGLPTPDKVARRVCPGAVDHGHLAVLLSAADGARAAYAAVGREAERRAAEADGCDHTPRCIPTHVCSISRGGSVALRDLAAALRRLGGGA